MLRFEVPVVVVVVVMMLEEPMTELLLFHQPGIFQRITSRVVLSYGSGGAFNSTQQRSSLAVPLRPMIKFSGCKRVAIILEIQLKIWYDIRREASPEPGDKDLRKQF